MLTNINSVAFITTGLYMSTKMFTDIKNVALITASLYMSMLCGPLSPHFYMSHVAKKTRHRDYQTGPLKTGLRNVKFRIKQA